MGAIDHIHSFAGCKTARLGLLQGAALLGVLQTHPNNQAIGL
jgi:hypothetical protein